MTRDDFCPAASQEDAESGGLYSENTVFVNNRLCAWHTGEELICDSIKELNSHVLFLCTEESFQLRGRMNLPVLHSMFVTEVRRIGTLQLTDVLFELLLYYVS